ncbi:MAG: hypothetical protein LBF42_03980 [Puniceicoccales bacterium]|nr:hypothetical protein [Puniceicoccales bacterium]
MDESGIDRHLHRRNARMPDQQRGNASSHFEYDLKPSAVDGSTATLWCESKLLPEFMPRRSPDFRNFLCEFFLFGLSFFAPRLKFSIDKRWSFHKIFLLKT